MSNESTVSTPDVIAKHPVAWLQPLPEGYKISILRWILLPATALMLKRNKGVWVSGELRLLPDSIQFVQSRLVKSARRPGIEWKLPLADIRDITTSKGVASETVTVEYATGSLKLITVRSEDFVNQIRQAMKG